MQKIAWRLSGGAVIGFAVVAACAGAGPSNVGATAPDDLAKRDAEELAKRGASDAGSIDDAGPKCPNGALEDPHRGFVRCLSPDERDAGWLPPPPQADVPPDDAGAPTPVPPKLGVAPDVEAGKPKFESGEVPKIEKILDKSSKAIAQCIADGGGLSGNSGNIKVQFLVRPRGRAEGVEIVDAKGISDSAKACVQKLFKNKAVGAPTNDPTGVTVTFTLKAAK